MADKNKVKIPKNILGFKFSNGSRKDLKRLIKMLDQPAAVAHPWRSPARSPRSWRSG